MYRTSLARKRLVGFAVIALLTISTLFTSCKKEEEEQPPTPTPSSMYSLPMSIGSYWIYQEEETDSLGNVTNVGAIDSVYIPSDTLINGNTYFKVVTFVGPGTSFQVGPNTVFLRDSAGYIVDQNGIFVEHDNFTDTLNTVNNTVVISYYFMKHPDSVVTVYAGSFTTIDYEGHNYAQVPNYPHPNMRYTHTLYADNVGMIKQVKYFFSQSGYLHRTLLRYHIQ